MVVTPLLMTENMELYLKFVLFRNILNKNQQGKNIWVPPPSWNPLLLLTFSSLLANFFFHNRPTPYNANLNNIFFHITMFSLNAK